MLRPSDLRIDIRVVSGLGALAEIGSLAKDLGFSRTLLVSDSGLARAGHLERAHGLLKSAGVDVFDFSDFGANPDSAMIEAGRTVAASHRIDSIVGLGGGSSLDCAKGINFVFTQGGVIHDFQGYGKASKPMLPMIGVPTTAGTGSEAQSYALISDARTHRKMACGDPKAAFRAVILDPRLTITQPVSVTAAAGYDAIAHAVESYVCTRRNEQSLPLSIKAWQLLESNYEKVLADPHDLAAREAMQLGAYYAGMAIEHSMLGATHACANPLTARYGTTHGDAIAVLLPHVVRWNAVAADEYYRDLIGHFAAAANGSSADVLAARLEQLRAAGQLPSNMRSIGATAADLPALALDAATQWTGGFNPRTFDVAGAQEVYECAF